MSKIVCFLLITSVLAVVAAFQQAIMSTRQCHDEIISSRRPVSKTQLQASWLPVWLEHFFHTDNNVAFSEKPELVDLLKNTTRGNHSTATVVRLAARQYDKDASQPSSRNYTTRKNARHSILVQKEGVVHDYNHYRTVALDSTPTRAVSIVTTDILQALLAQDFSLQNGDLGENILVDGIQFHELQIHHYYMVGKANGVLLQVTEPMIPCANLCQLPGINDESLAPKERIHKCRALLEFLSAPGDGFRGWYAQVVTGGEIRVGDEFRHVVNAANE